jgi:hypothetical protein
MDPGTSELFSSRIEETVYSLGNKKSKVENPRKRPDRIHGLQRTANFDRILQAAYAHDTAQDPIRIIEDVVNISMNADNGGEGLLFPSLILEAKGEKGAEGFENIEIQTSFPIKNALELQYDLMKTPGNTQDPRGGPLVWFFANHGED